ncbi:putative chromosomal passenger protein [Trypanosoma theileri]|uniref:Putative chromosomal passenger protein n=1 Tax=Trypanosoma theileri TaxID=67003 RepID=A0A1X0P1C3_9TRYP|nr:putative chromosomal passenger protein [Trypanosoma theileri]ORC90705.1 putative chromosomal passenger protein [Trypanosoma theileri]
MSAVWSSQLVEELLFRQYIKGEDVSMLLPPPPTLSADQYLENYDQCTKVLSSYVRNGPTAALSSQNVNTVSRLYGATPIKGQSSFSRTINQSSQNAAVAAAAEPKLQTCRTPNGKDINASAVDSPAPVVPNATTRTVNSSPVAHLRRNKIEWPTSVPTNASLKSSSRSKVAHLTAKRVAAQEGVDPDLVFAQNPEELPLHLIFANYPKALESLSAVRGGSGDWRNDTFTVEEENLYKRELGFVHVGPSQCAYGRAMLFQK